MIGLVNKLAEIFTKDSLEYGAQCSFGFLTSVVDCCVNYVDCSGPQQVLCSNIIVVVVLIIWFPQIGTHTNGAKIKLTRGGLLF